MYVKGYGVLSFLKNVSNKYTQKGTDTATKSIADPIRTSWKRAFQKTTEATGDLIANKIADKITSISKRSSQNASKELRSKADEDEIEIPKERYISREKDKKWLMN